VDLILGVDLPEVDGRLLVVAAEGRRDRIVEEGRSDREREHEIRQGLGKEGVKEVRTVY
jgi:hypothetical protein